MTNKNRYRLLRVFAKRTVLKNLALDFPAAIVVFLVALPLSLGIALASDAPLFSGLITAVIAGLVVSLLSGSEVSVSGPAAGLVVIVASGIKELGSFEAFLAAVVISGFFQVLLGLSRSGAIASLFPNSVIKGMVAAIGITIILKEIPHTFGGFDEFTTETAHLHWHDLENTFPLLKALMDSVNFSALSVALVSLGVMVFWDKKFSQGKKYLSALPGSLLAVFLGAVLNQVFHFSFPSLALHAHDGHLVQLPILNSWGAAFSELRFPDLSILSDFRVWAIAATIAGVGSIETLLCLESTEKIDPLRRVSHRNRELVAQGIGNMLSGCVGGIPMTSVIVRTSANIYAGAKTRYSAFLQGLILLISIIGLSSILNLIPLASLAAVLLAVGYRLTHPKLIQSVYHSGWDQFIPFLVTIIAILFTDLLQGVLIGLVFGLGFVVLASYSSAILVVNENKNYLIRFTKDVTFIHKVKLRKELMNISSGSHVFIDGTKATFFDPDILEMLRDFAETAPSRNIGVEMKNVGEKRLQAVLGRKHRSNDAILPEASFSE